MDLNQPYPSRASERVRCQTATTWGSWEEAPALLAQSAWEGISNKVGGAALLMPLGLVKLPWNDDRVEVTASAGFALLGQLLRITVDGEPLWHGVLIEATLAVAADGVFMRLQAAGLGYLLDLIPLDLAYWQVPGSATESITHPKWPIINDREGGGRMRDADYTVNEIEDCQVFFSKGVDSSDLPTEWTADALHRLLVAHANRTGRPYDIPWRSAGTPEGRTRTFDWSNGKTVGQALSELLPQRLGNGFRVAAAADEQTVLVTSIIPELDGGPLAVDLTGQFIELRKLSQSVANAFRRVETRRDATLRLGSFGFERGATALLTRDWTAAQESAQDWVKLNPAWRRWRLPVDEDHPRLWLRDLPGLPPSATALLPANAATPLRGGVFGSADGTTWFPIPGAWSACPAADGTADACVLLDVPLALAVKGLVDQDFRVVLTCGYTDGAGITHDLAGLADAPGWRLLKTSTGQHRIILDAGAVLGWNVTPPASDITLYDPPHLTAEAEAARRWSGKMATSADWVEHGVLDGSITMAPGGRVTSIKARLHPDLEVETFTCEAWITERRWQLVEPQSTGYAIERLMAAEDFHR
jgi:hypothetical protein